MFKNMFASWESSINLRFTIYPLLSVPDFWEAVDGTKVHRKSTNKHEFNELTGSHEKGVVASERR